MAVIELENITKKYSIKKDAQNIFSRKVKQEVLALSGVALSVDRGDVLGIVGANGSGKSTLLKILSRITPPTSGVIRVEGKILALLEVGVGFHSELTGRENIFLNGSILGMSKEETLQRVGRIIEFSGIKEFIDIQVKKYSSGMYVRLGFSIAASMDPDLLFIDEVLALGDIDFQNKCYDYISKATSSKDKTVIIVSHNLEMIQKLCNKCLWLNKGVVKEYGDVNKVIDSYLNKLDIVSADKIGSRKDRGGTGQVRITGLEMLDEDNSRVDFFLSGQNAVFAIYYEVKDQAITEFELAFSIDSQEIKERIANNFSQTINKKIQVVGQKGCVKLKINRLPLNIGKYYYNIWLLNDGMNYDNVLRAGFFNVMFGDFYRTGFLPPASHGVVLLDFDIEQ